MTVMKNVEVFFTKLVADRPIVLTDDDEKPATEGKLEGMRRAGATAKEIEQAEEGKVIGWELTGRTEDKAKAAAWKQVLGAKAVRAIREDKDDDESEIKYWQIKLRKKKFKVDGAISDPVEVVRGDTLEDLDPKIIGNGSIADVRIYQYDYSFKQKGTTIEGTASVLMAVKVKKLVKYTSKDREEFEKDDFEVVDPDNEDEGEDDGSHVSKEDEKPTKGKGTNKPKATTRANRPDLNDEIPF
jgi:hypothetical protein